MNTLNSKRVAATRCTWVAAAVCMLYTATAANFRGITKPNLSGLSGDSAAGLRLLQQQTGGLGSRFNLQSPPLLTEFQAAQLVNFTYDEGRTDLQGNRVPDQATIVSGEGFQGSASVKSSYDTATFSSSFADKIGGNIKIKFISAGPSYSKFVKHVSSSTYAAYQSSVNLDLSLQKIRVNDLESVKFNAEVEEALVFLNETYYRNGTASARDFYRFFNQHNAHFVSEYTLGGYAEFSVVSKAQEEVHHSEQARKFGLSVGAAFQGIGIKISGGVTHSSEDYSRMDKASTDIRVECTGGDASLCVPALDIPSFGTPPPKSNPAQEWADSLQNDKKSAASYVSEIAPISDVLRLRGQYKLAEAMDAMFQQYISLCPMDANQASVCSGHGVCAINADEGSARCQCSMASGSSSSLEYVGDHCSCLGNPSKGECSGQGTCDTSRDPNGPGQCKCESSFEGPACNQRPCPVDPFFQEAGECGGPERGECNHYDGTCSCKLTSQYDPSTKTWEYVGWRGPACTIPCGDQGNEDLFSIKVTSERTWGDVATAQKVRFSEATSDDYDEVKQFKLLRSDGSCKVHNGPGEIFFLPADDEQGLVGNTDHDHGWLFPVFYDPSRSHFPPHGWPDDKSTPGDAICQFVFNTWLKSAAYQGSFPAPSVTNASVFSSRKPKYLPQLYHKAEPSSYFSALPSTSYVDTLQRNPYYANPYATRSHPRYMEEALAHYPGNIFCFAQCPLPPAAAANPVEGDQHDESAK